ncbi:endopeptidase La [Helicobacter acinonychis]|uniref:Lon protease n=1 Tax=Helicobacter acinonychis (strain Sheeba) TaxID=382638 RepID=Q17ZK5_HELAH|nr:endopeptidase La [Helicobacter acinonychis]CAJ98921.1 ATP-dependent protease La [Helicobacter acinonychis str. Sheeba]STP04955.1 ATP-dependent protease La [Helicobacter acinonychis]
MTEYFPRILPVLVEEDTFLYPFMIAPIFLQNNASIKAVAYAKSNKSLVFIACQKDKLNDNEAPYYDVGVIGSIMREADMPNGRVKLLFNGIAKGRILEPAKENEQGFLEAQISPIEYLEYDKENIQAIVEVLKEKVITLANVSSLFPPDLIKALEDNDDPNRIADLIAAALRLKKDQAYSLFANNNTEQRLLDLIDIVIEETKTQKLQKEIKSKVHQKMEQVNKEYFLKEQLKQIQKELGTDKQRDEDLNQYYQKLESIKPFLKEEAFKEIKKQIDRLSRTHVDSSDSATLQSYIETMLDVPFGQYGKKALDIKHVREQLNKDHYSLKKPKERIVEYFATMQLLEMRQKKKQELQPNKKDKTKGTILCFYGPPGVGKTSLANSIAKAIEHPLVRIALGGLEDVNELRGHRRTYVGSMPGRIVQGLIEAKKMDPVMVLDEIDKVDRSVRGDPTSALLEILDPEQNVAFRDHYANFSIDLSQVIFIATANNVDRIPAPLRDRMEFISVSSYTPSEKEEIAKNYLIPQELEKHALKPSEVKISQACLKLIIEKYTREAGVRDLRRQIATIMRKVALKYLEDNPHKKGRAKKDENEEDENKKGENKDFCVSITPNNLKEYLERTVFEIDPIDKENKIGIVNGLAWTPVGGDVLKIEALKIRGKGELKLTGSLGDVMKESALIAFSVVKVLLDEEKLKAPKIPSETLKDTEGKKKKKALKVYNAYDLHLHVPEGATPKDGPSAGIAMASVIASILCDKATRSDVAMTGELTLSGEVLPIGGLKEKLIAAFKAGIKTALIPVKNYERDLDEIPAEVLENLKIVAVKNIAEVLEKTLL